MVKQTVVSVNGKKTAYLNEKITKVDKSKYVGYKNPPILNSSVVSVVNSKSVCRDSKRNTRRAKTMSTIVFQVSRYVAKSARTGYAQLRLKERYNSQGNVTALATLHLQESSNPWLQGMHYAVIDDDGSVYYGFEKQDPDQRVDYNINFTNHQINNLKSEIEALGSKLTNPPKDDEGVSELMGVQLHVRTKVGKDVKVSTVEPTTAAAARWGTKFKISVSPADIESVSIIQYGDSDYLEAPGEYISHSLLTQSLYKKAEVVSNKPTTVEEAKDFLNNLKAKKRGANRTADKAARQGVRGLDATVVNPPAVEAKVSKVLIDDEDENQPE